MGTVASELKSEREKRNISLSYIAAETRIGLRHLESLEEGRFNDLPGGMYNRAFLRAYCETLNLSNLEEIMQRYEEELAPASERLAKTKVHIPQQSRSFRISPLFVWGVMFAISATGLFFSRNWITAVFSPYFSHTPQAPVRYEPAQTKTAQTPPAAPVQAPESAVQAPVPVPVTEPVPPAQQTSVPSQLPVSELPAQPNPVPPAAPIRIEIGASEQCWVSVDRDGAPAFRKTMLPGEVQFLNASVEFKIILGNAAGVHLKINGKPAKPLGKPGEVVKFKINEKNLQDFLEQTAG